MVQILQFSFLFVRWFVLAFERMGFANEGTVCWAIQLTGEMQADEAPGEGWNCFMIS